MNDTKEVNQVECDLLLKLKEGLHGTHNQNLPFSLISFLRHFLCTPVAFLHYTTMPSTSQARQRSDSRRVSLLNQCRSLRYGTGRQKKWIKPCLSSLPSFLD